MRPSATLRIDTPCTESWANMTPQTDGRHCVACQQIVHDFTTFSDAELVAWFAQHPGPACGRLRDDQLGVTLYADQPVSAGSRVRSWVRWALALVLGWQTARAQQNAPSTATPAPLQKLKPLNMKLVAADTPPPAEPIFFMVRGQVLYSDGKPAFKAIIQRKDGGRFRDGAFVTTDANGQFAIPIGPHEQQQNSLALLVERQYEVTVSTRHEQPPLLVKLAYCNAVIRTGGIQASVTGQPAKRRK